MVCPQLINELALIQLHITKIYQPTSRSIIDTMSAIVANITLFSYAASQLLDPLKSFDRIINVLAWNLHIGLLLHSWCQIENSDNQLYIKVDGKVTQSVLILGNFNAWLCYIKVIFFPYLSLCIICITLDNIPPIVLYLNFLLCGRCGRGANLHRHHSQLSGRLWVVGSTSTADRAVFWDLILGL